MLILQNPPWKRQKNYLWKVGKEYELGYNCKEEEEEDHDEEVEEVGEGDEEHASVVFLMAMKEATERFHAEMHVKAINEGCTLLKLDTEAVRALTRQVEAELFADHFDMGCVE